MTAQPQVITVKDYRVDLSHADSLGHHPIEFCAFILTLTSLTHTALYMSEPWMMCVRLMSLARILSCIYTSHMSEPWVVRCTRSVHVACHVCSQLV